MGFKGKVTCSNDVMEQDLVFELSFENRDEALVWAQLTQAAIADVVTKAGFVGVAGQVSDNPKASEMLATGRQKLDL